jgi:hypothetical protein
VKRAQEPPTFDKFVECVPEQMSMVQDRRRARSRGPRIDPLDGCIGGSSVIDRELILDTSILVGRVVKCNVMVANIVLLVRRRSVVGRWLVRNACRD